MKVKYTNFPAQIASIRSKLRETFDTVLDSGHFILGPRLREFETTIAKTLGVGHAVGISNGTDALILALRQLGIGPGDEVITAPNSFIASASGIALAGATPRFADVGNDMNLDPSALEAAITPNTKVVIPVHLTGRPCRMPAIMEVAAKHGLIVLEDCAQAIGSRLDGKSVGTWGKGGAFSCHPLKSLFTYGDSGMIVTSDADFAASLAMARSHGMPNRDTCSYWSYNFRMDELHAALLLDNLTQFPLWIEERRRLAFRYNEALGDLVIVPVEGPGEFHTYQTYMIRIERRDALQQYLQGRGVEAIIHYRVPIHLQPAAASLGYGKGSFPMAEKLADTILSLPLYPGLSEVEQDYVIASIRGFFA